MTFDKIFLKYLYKPLFLDKNIHLNQITLSKFDEIIIDHEKNYVNISLLFTKIRRQARVLLGVSKL